MKAHQVIRKWPVGLVKTRPRKCEEVQVELLRQPPHSVTVSRAHAGQMRTQHAGILRARAEAGCKQASGRANQTPARHESRRKQGRIGLKRSVRFCTSPCKCSRAPARTSTSDLLVFFSACQVGVGVAVWGNPPPCYARHYGIPVLPAESGRLVC